MVLEMLHVGSGRSAGVHDLDQLLEATNERIPTKLRHLCRAIGGHVPCLSIRIDNGPRDSVSVLRECSGWHFDVYRLESVPTERTPEFRLVLPLYDASLGGLHQYSHVPGNVPQLCSVVVTLLNYNVM